MATGSYDVRQGSAWDEARGQGWIVFASVMLAIAGIWNVIDGLLAVGDSKVYGAVNTYVFSDLRTWGWIVMGLGLLQILAAFGVLSGSEAARWFGIAAAGLNAIGQLGFMPVYPFWALTMFALDVMIIYALAVYGGRKGPAL